MDIFKFFDKLGKENRALILYSLLNRIPIIVFGKVSEDINELINELMDLIKFRKEFVYYTDFISKQEYEDLILNEYNDYNCARIQIRCLANVSSILIEEFDTLESIIIGIRLPDSKRDLKIIQERISNKTKDHIELFLKNGNTEVITNIMNKKILNLYIEESIFQKVSKDTEKSINKMKRVLSEELRKNKIDIELEEALLNFELEKKEIKRNIFNKEIQSFYSGAKRAFFILLKLKLINQMQLQSMIGSRTLLETIDYEEAPIERILSFIQNEWGEDFTNLIENNKLTLLGEKIQSFWG
ncbi:MAG: hypothetical protein ACQERB_10945 [Promethearchaeati archaeon]